MRRPDAGRLGAPTFYSADSRGVCPSGGGTGPRFERARRAAKPAGVAERLADGEVRLAAPPVATVGSPVEFFRGDTGGAIRVNEHVYLAPVTQRQLKAGFCTNAYRGMWRAQPTLCLVLAKPPACLVRQNDTWRQLLIELFEEAFAVRAYAWLNAALPTLTTLQHDLLIVDVTGCTELPASMQSTLVALSGSMPVLLLVDTPELAYLAHAEYGRCSAVYEPFNDFHRFLAAATELAGAAPSASR
jgi:hypothetical protein